MIAYIEGKITLKNPEYVYIDVGGLAYHIDISMNTFSQIEAKKEVRLYTYLHVKEDGHYLFGFYEEQERTLFKLLISVSGIGPSTAMVILSSMRPEQVASAIQNEQDASFKGVKGIGPKTAKRIILDLKDKIKKLSLSQSDSSFVQAGSGMRTEVLSALKGLGIHRSKAEPLVDRVMKENPEKDQLEDILKLVLKQLN